MLIAHREKQPRIDASAYVAPNVTLSGDVTIGANSRVLFNAVLTAEGGPIVVGANCVVMEGAVIRGTRHNPATIGDHVLIGPQAYLTGCTIGDNVFLATRATVFNGARVEENAEVRINGVVHLRTRVPRAATVPIGWVAVGDPAEILPPEEHDEIWRIQEALDFPKTVFGLERPTDGTSIMPELTRRYVRFLDEHKKDRPL